MPSGELDAIDGADHPSSAPIEDVRVHHRGRHVLVAEQFLHGTDVVAEFQQVRRERRSVCGVAGLAMPAPRTALFIARWNA